MHPPKRKSALQDAEEWVKVLVSEGKEFIFGTFIYLLLYGSIFWLVFSIFIWVARNIRSLFPG